MAGMFSKDTKEPTIRRKLKRDGWSESRINNYLRGWLQVKCKSKEN